jgi:hypothetical protein
MCSFSSHQRRKREEDDCDGGKDVNSFGVAFSSYTDRVSGLLNSELLAPVRVSLVRGEYQRANSQVDRIVLT